MDSSGTEPRIPPGYFAKGSQTIQVIAHVIYHGNWGLSVCSPLPICLSVCLPGPHLSVRDVPPWARRLSSP
jgi:hypothetical protein